jgi:hypothetical protein
MTRAENCVATNCKRPFAATLDGDSLCREHFIASSYERLDAYNEKQRGPGLSKADAESARRFINECTRQADEIEHTAKDLNNLERAKLLHIILSASELGCHLRRSPRKAASIAVRISSEKLGGAWEENTETVLLSQFGASVKCSHTAKTGETIQILRADTGQKAEARIAWQRASENDGLRIGVEFIGCENFWELDWAAIEEAR